MFNWGRCNIYFDRDSWTRYLQLDIFDMKQEQLVDIHLFGETLSQSGACAYELRARSGKTQIFLGGST